MRIEPKLSLIAQALKRARGIPVYAGFICTTALISGLPVNAAENENVAEQQTEAEQQAEATKPTDKGEVVLVVGARQTIRKSISIKKQSNEIVDGLTASDIGDLPALSIGEALESLTGASSHREQGGATEISIRGLGPFLGSTVFNGREATNGSGDRSVNFSQFPSELFNKIAIYKTQEASFIEGGVSGQIHLDTVKPLDYGKQRAQFEYKANWNPDNSQLEYPERDLGSRVTASYVDQFNSDKLGEFGISIGVQKNLSTNPEQEARTTSGWRDCRFDPSSSSGVYSSGNCDSGSGDLVMEVDPQTGQAPDAGVPFIFAPSSYSYRQNITDDDRESLFTAFQWRPTNKMEINVDAEYSNRVFSEIRNDLVFAESRRIDSPDVPPGSHLPGDLVVTSTGAVRSRTNEQRIETNSQFQERLEKYNGGGISFAYDVDETLTITADLSYSKTKRQENIFQTRLQSEPVDIYGNPVPGAANSGRVETAMQIMQNGSLIPIFTVQNFDVTNHDLFADAARTRVDLNQLRNNEIKAFRSDFEYLPESDSISSIKGGVRLSQLTFDSVPRQRDEYNFDDAALAAANIACRNDVFPESGFLSSVSGGFPLITNVDSDGNVIASGTGNSWATFDPRCLAETLIGGPITIPGAEPSIANTDVKEETTALYLQADYDTVIGDKNVRGNFGVRYVKTDVTSRGYRGELTAVYDTQGVLSDIVSTGELATVEGGSSYSEWLPSFNAVMDVKEDVLLRGAVYRALSRPDPSDLGFGRSFSGLSGNNTSDTLDDAIGLAVANGNPSMKPMTSWNADLALEWYPNDDTILGVGIYYKKFKGGFENASQIESFTVDGQSIDTIVTTQQVVDDTSTITGVELNASHSFDYMDNWLKYFGFKLGYNYADSDFEFEDAQFGASTVFQGDQLVQRVALVAPADIFGLSRHVASGQIYYELGDFTAAVNYKYRSEYFQQFISTPGNLRFIGDTEVFEMSMSYRYNSHVKFSLKAINLFDEPRRQFNPTRDNFAEINVYGPRVFAGVQVRL